LSGKYNSVYYNELNPLLEPLIKDAVAGKYNYDNFTPEWISGEEFHKRKDTDGYVKYIWSFGNKGDAYMFGGQIRPWKEAFFKALFGDYSFFDKMDIHPPKVEGRANERRLALARWIKANMQDCKAKYIKYFIELIDVKKRELGDIIAKITDVKGSIKEERARLQTYLREALAKSKISASEVDKHCGCHMSGHWFGNSQWVFPTYEMYKKMQEVMPALDKDYFEVTNYMTITESLQSLESLESLQRLERLQSLESLERLELHTGSYLDYEYQDGDVVYCDPPYENTVGYSNDKIKSVEKYYSEKAQREYTKTKTAEFNSKEFYDWVASRPYTVCFSSFEISDNRFFVIGEKEKANLLKAGGTDKKSIEKLYCNRDLRKRAEPVQLDLLDIC
jgi:hypothetical protein